MTTNAERLRIALAGAERQAADFRKQLEKEEAERGFQFLTDYRVGDAIIELVMAAKERLDLVSPFRWNWKLFEQEVLAAQRRKVAVTLYVREFDNLPSQLHYECEAIALGRQLNPIIYVSEQAAILCSHNAWARYGMEVIETGMLITDKDVRLHIDSYIDSLKERQARRGQFG